jgi:cobalamin biosynthetic protein CobC
MSDNALPEFNPEHGGNLLAASEYYGTPFEQWLDLSTGVNPNAYPVRNLPVYAFTNLPYVRPEFLEAAAQYYGCENFLAVPGSQWAIQHLPDVLPNLPVLVPSLGYQEHTKQWTKEHFVMRYPDLKFTDQHRFINDALEKNPKQHLVIINPNNPMGTLISRQQLLTWAETLAEGAYLIVDEAFIDCTPEHSLLGDELPENVIVLRSFGKFFGLAGIRLGFVFANAEIREKLSSLLGLWQVSGPAQALGTQAFNDNEWQTKANEEIAQCREYTEQWLAPVQHALTPIVLTSSGLFISWLLHSQVAQLLVTSFAQQSILVRLIKVDDQKSIVRFGLLDQMSFERLSVHTG